MDGDGDIDIKKTIFEKNLKEKRIYLYENIVKDGKRKLDEQKYLGSVPLR